VSLTRLPGQRYEIIINATEPIANYWWRVGTGGRCDGPNTNAANVRSIFRYAGAGSGDPNSTARVLPAGCYDESNIVPYQKTTVPREMPEELNLGFNPDYTSDVSHAKGLVQWLVNGNPMAVDLDRPTLQSVLDRNVSYGSNRHVFEVDEKSQVSLCATLTHLHTNKGQVAILGDPTRPKQHYTCITSPHPSPRPRLLRP
jgi:hypothetical protein